MATDAKTTVNPAASLPDVACLLEESMFRHAGAVAVESDAGSISYRTLKRNSAELAAALGSVAGARPSTVVVMGTRDPRFVTAVVGVLRAGLRLVTLDPAASPAHMARVAELCHPAVWIGLDASVPPSGCVLQVDGVGRVRAPQIESGYDRGDRGDEAPGGYVFFTSGTSGLPKAVLGRADSLARFLEWERQEFGFGPEDRFGQLTAAGFDVVLRDVLAPLISGARVVLPPAGLGPGDPLVLRWLAARRITHLHAVPSVVAAWLRGSLQPALLAELRQVLFAGEPLAGSLVRQVRELAPHVEVANLYGPTETTLAAFAYRVPQEVEDAALLPVGRPRPDVQVGFVDAAGSFDAGATSGEVAIRTAFASRGYLGASPQEEARFEFTAAHVTYRTGDAGHLDTEGNLHLAGRLDSQVKINGVRVEPDGIAALIACHPAVAQAVVDVVRSEQGRPRLTAFVAGELEAEQVRTWLAERVASAHVPTEIRVLPRLPLLPNGKVDRRALANARPATGGGDATGAVHDPAASGLLRTVIDVFTEVLGIPVSPTSDFFELGGDSLDAAVLSQRLQEAAARLVRYADILECRNPAALSQRLDARSAHRPAPIPPAPPRSHYPLSPQQRRYLRVYLPRRNRTWANMPALWDLPATTTAGAVHDALNTLVARHDSLRAVIVRNPAGSPAGSARQRFVPPRPVPLTVRTVPGDLPPEQAEEWIAAAARADAGQLIDIETWPLFRATFFEHPDSPKLAWNPHHLISDGHSQNVILRELTALLAGEPLAPAAASYRDFACWRASQESGGELSAQRAYWEQVFAEPYAPLQLPASGKKAARAAGRAYQLCLDEKDFSYLTDYARGRGVTPFAVVLAAHMTACHDLFASPDIVIGTPAAGRTHEQTSDTVGNFISLVTMRHRLGESASFGELADLMHQRTSLAMTHQDHQYDHVMDLVGAPDDDDRFPLTTAFISQVEIPPGQPVATTGHRELGIEVKFDLMLYLRTHGTHLALDLLYRAECLQPSRAKQYVHGLLDTIRDAQADLSPKPAQGSENRDVSVQNGQ